MFFEMMKKWKSNRPWCLQWSSSLKHCWGAKYFNWYQLNRYFVKKNRYANLTKRIKKEKSKSLHWYLGVILLKINWLEAVGKMAGVCIVIDFSDLIRFNSVAVLTSLCHSYLSILIQLLNKYENRLIGGRMINVKLLNFSCYLE